jgi:DNA-binding NarL/FixJ family response regulator
MPFNESIRLLIADDHALIKEGFKNVLVGQSEIELVALASNGRDAIELSQKENPHVVIMDIKMPLMNGIEACRHLQQNQPEVKVIAFSMFDDEYSLIQMRLAGACGYLLKNADASEVVKAVRVVHEGGEYYCQALRERISHLFKSGKLGLGSADKKETYSEVELRIIKLLCQELTSKEIADALKINRRTVEHHKEHIQEKMGVQSSVGIAVYAVNNWLL